MHKLITHVSLVTIGLVALLVMTVILAVVARRRPRRLDVTVFTRQWLEVQTLCHGTGKTWPIAIVNADKLLDEALKQSKIRGKTMGERLVSAQRRLTNNDGVWFGHKLRNKVVHEEIARLYRRDVQTALRGFQQALKDLGALK